MNCSHNAATCSNEQSFNVFPLHRFMIGMRFLFVMKLSRFMVNPFSSSIPSLSLPGLGFRTIRVYSWTLAAISTILIQASEHSPNTDLHRFSDISSLPFLLKKSSLRPEQILQA